MWDKFFGSVAVAELEATPVAATGAALMMESPEFKAEYQATAQRVGFKCPAEPQTLHFQRFLAEGGFCTYDKAQVTKFLTTQYGRPGAERMPKWGWRPLRSRDVSHDTAYDNILDGSPNGCLLGGRASYAKPIPLPVLLTIERIQHAFPIAEFFISDETSRDERVKDPFLLVRVEGVNYIIERWDEPSFRGK